MTRHISEEDLNELFRTDPVSGLFRENFIILKRAKLSNKLIGADLLPCYEFYFRFLEKDFT